MSTYNDLWWDKEFVEKRIREQQDYVLDVQHAWAIGNITLERASELTESARVVCVRFEQQLKEIEKLKGHCCRY